MLLGATGRREGVGEGFCVVRRRGNAARFISVNLVYCPEGKTLGLGLPNGVCSLIFWQGDVCLIESHKECK
jgi:hypothetical protein